jgi:phage shock protein A
MHPMGLMQRFSTIFKAKANKALDRAEDPRETLDYSYQRQLEMLTKVRRGLADVATSRKRVELELDHAQQAAQRLHGQAREALQLEREDLARESLTRRSAALAQIDQLWPQAEALRAEEDKLTAAAERLQAKVEAFRTRKETVKAGYTAAEAQTRINEAVSGVSEELGDVGLAVQRAEDKTAQMSSRAQALDELMASGALDDASIPVGQRDDIQAALDSARGGDAGIEGQLAQLRHEITGPQTPAQLERGESPPERGEGDPS